MSEDINEEQTKKIDIKKKRKSMFNKKDLIDLEEYQDNKNKKGKMRRKSSIKINSVSNLNLMDKKEETKDDSKNLKNIPKHRSRKSTILRPMIGLSKFVTLKGQLTNISELIINQEPDVSEMLCGCEQPNNYHVYLRERNGQLTYIYKLREFSGQCNRIFCPVNCREFTMKMKLMSPDSNKYDTNFRDSLMTLQRNCKIPCLCLIRPELIIDLSKEKLRLENKFKDSKVSHFVTLVLGYITKMMKKFIISKPIVVNVDLFVEIILLEKLMIVNF